jgi:hypothetical protein
MRALFHRLFVRRYYKRVYGGEMVPVGYVKHILLALRLKKSRRIVGN